LLDGASLIYTTPSTPSQLPSLLHSSLGIHSLLKKQPLKPNVIDRDKIVVPPNWDSWGKIRVLREGFDVELVSNGWTIDLEQPFPTPQPANGAEENGDAVDGSAEKPNGAADPQGSTVRLYEMAVQDPSMDALQIAGRNNFSTKLEVETMDSQSFLAQQLTVLEAWRQKTEQEADDNPKAKSWKKSIEDEGTTPTEAKVTDHIGPVQFNMGGIQVDADDMVQRLKVRCGNLGAYDAALFHFLTLFLLGSSNLWIVA
jgi:dynein light intermediate chain 1